MSKKIDRISEAKNIFDLARYLIRKTGKLEGPVINAMETAIEVLFRCKDYEEAAKYANTYGTLMNFNELVQNRYIGFN